MYKITALSAFNKISRYILLACRKCAEGVPQCSVLGAPFFSIFISRRHLLMFSSLSCAAKPLLSVTIVKILALATSTRASAIIHEMNPRAASVGRFAKIIPAAHAKPSTPANNV